MQKPAKFLSTILALNLSLSPIATYAIDVNAAKIAGVDLSRENPLRSNNQQPIANSLEAGIWSEASKVELKASTSGERTSHRELETYVQSVVARILGARSMEVRTYVMERPFFNASVAPNGYTEVWTGLLLRVQSEDELAFVLGHEAGHYLRSHSVQTYQEYKDRQAATLALSLLLTVAAASAAANANSIGAANNIMNSTSTLIDIVYLGSLASFLGYNRDKEAAADIYGYDFALSGGYYPRAGENIWRRQIDETAASDEERKRRSPTRINVFGSHPLELERIEALRKYDMELNQQNQSASSSDVQKRADYRNRIRPYLSNWLRDDLRRRDFGQTIFVINNLLIDKADAGVLNFYKGEALRLRGREGDFASALGAYQEALLAQDAPVETNRQIGEIYRRQDKKPEALAAYKAYVAAAPNAEDAWIIQDLISQLEQ
ncbi:MAG: peptidase m48 ste24p [Hyphomonadaceae bacterium]|nr:MAG: peptidase m48 ste24p [Hyphomonadaceae bacterium]